MNYSIQRVGNSRLLYKSGQVEAFSAWFDEMCALDHFITSHHRLHLATHHFYCYFFGQKEEEAATLWYGREVVGFDNQLSPGLAFFDGHSGEVLTFELEADAIKNVEALFKVMNKLREQVGQESLAKTWRVKISDIDNEVTSHGKQNLIYPKILLQFFKNC